MERAATRNAVQVPSAQVNCNICCSWGTGLVVIFRMFHSQRMAEIQLQPEKSSSEALAGGEKSVREPSLAACGTLHVAVLVHECHSVDEKIYKGFAVPRWHIFDGAHPG